MVADYLTVFCFIVLCSIKLIPIISQYVEVIILIIKSSQMVLLRG